VKQHLAPPRVLFEEAYPVRLFCETHGVSFPLLAKDRHAACVLEGRGGGQSASRTAFQDD
jgi:hypothetical protein